MLKTTFVPLPAGVGSRSVEAMQRELVRDLLAVSPDVLRAAPARRRGRPGVRLVCSA
jgi:hypothetical protein